ncbi:MAG TPA: potassium-transporting ATPase subunit KdpA [Vicinamibacterales bacterium]|jgi:K+-transporting ATPase ATPase A chain|nr:potassium-transporting ATPase subunit KdpA [Vicinamibacterales bacterium]
MTSIGILQIVAFFGLVLVLTKPVGLFMSRLFQGERTFLHPVVRPIEALIYKICVVREDHEQRWTQYTASVLAFSVVSFVFVYGFQRLQGLLPFNPQGFGAAQVPPDASFNTAMSFMTNTNWQSYSGESTMSYLVQMMALAVQNFASAATGIAVAIALIRGFARNETEQLGNFWVDLTRGTLYILLPLAFVAALVFCSQGVIQNFHPYTVAKTVEGATQTIAQGPVASQEAIKQLGTNGGGFFNANSAHPFESPNPLTNFLQIFLIFVLGAGLTYTFGHMVKDTRQGWALFWAMAVMFLLGVFIAYPAEQAGNPIIANLGVQSAPTAVQPGGNMEGKETRFGISASALFATVTTDASCGAVNSMHDSYTPLGGLVPLFNLQTDEVIFGGVGAGLYGMLLYAILGVFIAGLMVGRTPEYIGKKIQRKEVTMALFAILATSFFILVFSAITLAVPFAKGSYWNPAGPGIANMNNAGPHGLTEILYAFTSQTENNGSAFAGLTVNTPWYDLLGGLAMLFGRFLFIIPALAAAGSLASKKAIPTSAGTLPTHGALFVGLLVATVVVVGALTFFPALSLGPIVEHFLMHQGKLFSAAFTSIPAWS